MDNNSGCSINDKMHDRIHNPITYDIVDLGKVNGIFRADTHHMESKKFHEISKMVFTSKWGTMNHQCWDEYTVNTAELNQATNRQSMLYPYFESKFAMNNRNYNYIHGNS